MAVRGGGQIVTRGLVFAMDGGTTRSHTTGSNKVYDLSGFENTGTLSGSVVFSPTIGRGSFLFTSTQHINFGSGNSIDLSGTNMTLCAWVRSTSLSSNGHILGKQAYGTGYILHYDAAYETVGGAGFQTTNVNNTQWEWGADITNAVWYHVAYTYDGTTERGYYNGVQVGTKAISSTISTNSSYNLYVGANNTMGDGWDGYIASVHVYNRTLSAAEILQNYNATKGRFD